MVLSITISHRLPLRSLESHATLYSKYQKRAAKSSTHRPTAAQDPVGNECVYPFGFDPIWFRTEQEIAFMNSFKMKLSVILGVSQMLLGTCLKGFNAIYFGRPVEFIFVVIAQILLMLSLFGFMNYLIVVKWTTNWDQVVAEKLATSGQLWAAPGIIAQMIVMFI